MSRGAMIGAVVLAAIFLFSGTCREIRDKLGIRRPGGAAGLDVDRAFSHTEALVKIGERRPATEGSAKARDYIVRQLEGAGLKPQRQPFEALTPIGPLPMENVWAEIPGDMQTVIVLAAHFDTKRLPFEFVGANDNASGTGLLLELARVLAKSRSPYTIWVVFMDGEEAIGSWSPNDSLYGSRHFVRELQSSGEIGRVSFMALFDMIGDADLTLIKDKRSSSAFRELFWETARELGYEEHFPDDWLIVDDDHIPFLQAGVRAVDLIDFRYGDGPPPGSYWHAAEDTIDKISPESLGIVGDVFLLTLPKIEALLAQLGAAGH